MVHIVEQTTNSTKNQKEHLILIDKIISRIKEFDDLEQNVRTNGFFYNDPVSQEKLWIRKSSDELASNFSSLSIDPTNKLYIPEYDYEHDKPEDILKMSANTFDYDRFVKEWKVSTDSQTTNLDSTLPNYYKPTIGSILNENQTKLIYNAENSSQIRINYKKNYSTSSSSSQSSNSNSELKYVMYLATVVKDDKESSDKSVVVLNNTKLKQEIDSNLGIFSKTNKNTFNTNSGIKVKKQICEFIPGNDNMPGCDIEITITAEDLSRSSSHENIRSRTDEPSQISSSNHSSKSFTQEAKQILQQHIKQHLEQHAIDAKKENKSNLNLMSSNSTLNISDLSDSDKLVNSNDSSDHIYCQISDATSTNSKQERILRKANERHKKQTRKKNSRNNSSENMTKKTKKKKKEFAIYANEPPVVRFYESSGDTKNNELKEKKKKRQAPVIKKPDELSNESNTVDRESSRQLELFYDSLDQTTDLPNETLNYQSKDSLDDDEQNPSVTIRRARQNSFLLNKILLIDPDEKHKKDAQMFHTDKYLKNKILYEKAEAYLKEIRENKRLLEYNVTKSAVIIPIPERKTDSIDMNKDLTKEIKENINNKTQIEKNTEQEEQLEEEEIEMKSDSETGEKVPANTGNRRSSTATFVNYHFLSKQEKKIISAMNEEMDTDDPKTIEERKKLEETIHMDMEKKKELINSDLNEYELNKKEDNLNLNPSQLGLLTKYRRESAALPYLESFFPEQSASRRGSTDSNEEKPPARVNNIVSGRRKSSENETPPKPDQNRRRNSTAAFVNYHFLNRNEKSNILKTDSDTEDDTKSSILSKIPIIGSRIESRRNSSAGQNQQQEQEDVNARKRFEDSIKDEIERKKDLLKLDLNESELEKKQEAHQLNLNPSQKALLNKYRRESVTSLPYADSFFSSPIKSPTNSTADPNADSNTTTATDTKSISSLKNQTVSAKTMELHNKFKKEVTSPIDNEMINLIEKLPTQDTDIQQPPLKQHKKSLTIDSRLSLTDYDSNKERSVNSASSSWKSTKSKENVFRKLKTKLKEKLEK